MTPENNQVLTEDERQLEAGPTRAERLGHQPGKAARDLGPGEVVVVEAPDGRDDEGPPVPVTRSISHLPRPREPRSCETDARGRAHTQEAAR